MYALVVMIVLIIRGNLSRGRASGTRKQTYREHNSVNGRYVFNLARWILSAREGDM